MNKSRIVFNSLRYFSITLDKIMPCCILALIGFLSVVLVSLRLDPYEQLRQANDTYSISSYKCVFTKNEIVNGKQMPTQRSDVWVLEDPFSIYMIPHKPVQAQKILYIENRFVKDGKEYMVVGPCGWLRLFVSSVWIAIDDPAILKRSRNTICSFGFKRTLDRTMESLAEYMHIVLVGKGEIDGRPTQVFEHDDGNHLLVLHLDAEWNLPVALYLYEAGILIGSYEFSNVQLNPGLAEADFDPVTRNLR